ncbi:MAG: hypothetical protein HY235_22365 [Acidobacteria bacterium]|nr:hypothetical protein [Acidobacteriota bacterium]
MQNNKLLQDIQSDNADVRFAAWRAAGAAEPAVIAELVKLVGSSNPGVAKAAREAITTIVHTAGKDPSAPQRAALVQQLLSLAGSGGVEARVLAFRLLSNIAGEDSVTAIAKYLSNAGLREEVVYCLERIPGAAANKALMGAYRTAADEFKPRILAALGHRRAPEAAALCLDAMRSPNKDLAAAAVRAFGRIGRKPPGAFRWPDGAEIDAMLRYADAQRDQGNHGEAMRVYKTALARPEEHLQCAAIHGIARMGTAEAATAIFPLLKSPDARVRITAQKAWRRMAQG